jgi:purine-binding chemotaxis protein CheW
VKLHIVFCLAGTEFALPVESVLQMESFGGATFVPGAPPYVAGLVTVRGRVVPVVDLRVRFGLPAADLSQDTRIIVSECSGRVIALRVDSAREVLMLDVSQNQPAPEVISERASGFVYAVHTLGRRLLLLVDLPKILGETSHDLPSTALLADASSEPRPQLPG